MKLVLLYGRHKVKTPKIDQLEYSLFCSLEVSVTGLLEAKKEFYNISSAKTAYLLKLHPPLSQWLLLEEYKLVSQLGSWFYSFDLITWLVANYILCKEESVSQIAKRELNGYKCLLTTLDCIEDELLAKAIEK